MSETEDNKKKDENTDLKKSDDDNGKKNSGEDQDKIEIYVKASAGGQREPVHVMVSMSVLQLKQQIESAFSCASDRMRLIYKGRVLEDARLLSDYGLKAEHTIHLVKSPIVGGNQGDGQSNISTTTNSAPAQQNSQQQGASMAFPVGAMGGFGSGDINQLRQQMMRNPAMMEDMMNSSAMQNLMQNPEMMRMLIQTNPQLREITERHPELAHVLNDPQTLRQAMEVARNPELMREQMRTTDRAMANIEGHPEGFNMLRRMYENVQEPLMSATETREDPSNPFASLFTQTAAQTAVPSNAAPNTEPLPNPWATGTEDATEAAGRGTATGASVRSTGGLGGLGGLSDLGSFGGMQGLPNPAQLSQMMEDPGVQQMMQSMMSNPAVLESMLQANPQMRQMMDANPQMRQMLSDPEILRNLSDPNTMRQVMNIQSRMQQLMGGDANSSLGAGQLPDYNSLLGMMGGVGGGGQRPSQNPEELYARQLQQLQDMGFYDRSENIRALQASRGNVNGAVEHLLAGGGGD